MATLNSPRFQGIDTLEQCLNGLRTMPPQNGALPETDADATRAVQRALVDLGYLLSYDEVDGSYGLRTSSAVSRFKADRGISPSDGVVGRKTSRALDDEFPAGTLSPGLFAAFVTANRLDSDIAGLLNELSGAAPLAWAPQTSQFAMQELTNQNLAGIVRASNASALKQQVPASQHVEIDNIAAKLAAASTRNGPFAFASSFDQAGFIRGHIMYQDAYVDRASPGDERHTGALLSLAHELTHFRNRVFVTALRLEPITSANYVDVQKAIASLANGDVKFTRATFIEEVSCRHLAWKVFQDLVLSHAQLMLATGVLTRPAAVGELQITLQPGQLFRSAIKFADDGASPNETYFDNGYMADLIFQPAPRFNTQVANWMLVGNQLIYHNEAARTDEIRTTLTNEFNSQSPAFATPTQAPAGLISG